MVKILLPTMAAYMGDVKTQLGLLEKTVRGKYEIGLEIVGKPEHFQEERHLRKIRDNIRSVAKGAYVVIHGFSGLQVYESGLSDMRTSKGRKLLETYLKLGRAVDASYVHVHGGAGYKGRTLTLHEKRVELNKVRENLLYCKRKLSTEFQLGVETLPSPSMGDVEMDPKKVWHDHCESLVDCLAIVDGTELKVTFDTCHYGADKGEKINLIEPIEMLGGHFGLLHANDISGYWVPYKSTWKEGVVPGDGRIGRSSFRKMFAYIKRKHPHVGISIEAYNADYKNPIESKESIIRVLKWLE